MAASESNEGPVMSLMSKRLRNLRKRHKKILQLEDEISLGKTLNKDQEETLRSKPSVLTLIDEYEKLRQPLSAAIAEELNLNHHSPSVNTNPDESSSPLESQLEEIIKLVYFGLLFDVKEQSEFTSTMVTRTHERGCCLTYDYVTDDANTELLGEKDLDMISVLNGMVVSRPANSCISHKNALKSCLEHAKLWLANSDQPIEQGANVTYAALKERLNKILASDYYTTSPEMKATDEVAAAAAGKYVPVQGSSVSSEITVQTESDYAPYEQKDEETEQSETPETGADQSSPVEEHPKEAEIPNAANDSSIQEDKKPEVEGEEQNYRDEESRDQQQNSRRGYQNYRGNRGGGGGGRRGGFPNGRGGRGGRGGPGGYQNGRGQGQFYDQPGNSYPRNYYNSRGRGGGGRGGAGGGNAYNNVGGSVRGGYAQAEEVRS
ncbi:hypothetical protein ACHQM5_006050 [Ranunculus cassubicifolius]